MKYHKKISLLYTFSHFLVDFTTVYLISAIILGPPIGITNRGMVIILYNLLAFAGQLPIGILADAVRKNHLFASIGCVFSALAYLAVFLSPVCACVLAALGNAFFHVGAGTDILEMSMPKAGLSGLFVSSGALGVWLAYKADSEIFTALCPLVMIVLAIMVIFTKRMHTATSPFPEISFRKPSFTILSAIGCFMLTIVFRSLLGMIMNFSWKAVPLLSFLFTLAVVAGKALGGFVGDKIGHVKAAALSLSVSFIAFIFSFNVPFLGIIAAVCFNMTMPLTLTAIASLSRNKYGFSFGLTTFALAIGFIPTIYGASSLFTLPFLLLSVAFSLILMMTGYYFSKKSATQEK